ncbi:MAG: sigma-70 family RNA polymerase sigma factor [Planctomycetaceae bacterium]
MMTVADGIVDRAQKGDESAFQELVSRHQRELASYFYRMTGSRADAEDLSQELWMRVLRNLSEFRQRSSFRTWIFAIATRLAMDHHRAIERWPADAQDRAKEMAESGLDTANELRRVQRDTAQGRYEMREHIDFCLTCLMKTLPLDQQLAIMLSDIYSFKNTESAEILGVTLSVAKHLLHEARRTLDRIFEHRCALINKQGVCHQCSELNGFFNPSQHDQERLLQLEIVQKAELGRRDDLLELRTCLARNIDPLHSEGADLQEAIMSIVRRAAQGTSRLSENVIS